MSDRTKGTTGDHHFHKLRRQAVINAALERNRRVREDALLEQYEEEQKRRSARSTT